MPLPSVVHEPHLRGDSVRRIAARFGLGQVARFTALAAGYLNCNYRVETDIGQFFVKRHPGAPLLDLQQRHQLVQTLQARGLPVGAPLADDDGRTWTVVNHRAVAVFPWIDGEHRVGLTLSDAECLAVGRLLGRTHGLLREIGGDQPQPFLLPAIQIDRRLTRAELLLARVRAQAAPDPFDALAEPYLVFVVEQLRRSVTTRLRLEPCLTGWQLTHGDFHQLNVLFTPDGQMTLVDWDRVRVQPRLSELVRGLVLWLHDPETGALDVRRAAMVTKGYAAEMPVEPGALAAVVEHFWQTKLADLWILDRHYDQADCSADDLLPSTLGWLQWLTEHRQALGQALEAAAGCSPGVRVSARSS
jgi:Ser/Thr protein kinase RdoA (MazF antagonist)